ncbi:MAG: hypothetical protein JNJ73_06120 [Hyphomonadaceae bacterium]|nr:hypothetical protein [Hyphomonadaceae bacterium]
MAAVYALACGVAVAASWRRAVLGGKLAALPLGKPRHDHINGWSILALALAVSLIAGLAAWAAAGQSNGEASLSSELGAVVVFGLAIAFVIAALAPALARVIAPRGLGGFARAATTAVRPFGLVISAIDSVLVFAVAEAAGAHRKNIFVRYAMLGGVIIPSAVLGYYLSAPWGLVPIAGGFVVAIAISRRWAWIEDDREIYMLNHRYTGAHIRIGFAQDLRDEALLSFMSLFFLVPLALWQVHKVWPFLFDITSGPPIQFWDWIGYFGTELAKAVPFVDWAEIYQVQGVARIHPTGVGRHVVFATRVLVDLVFLAALLQALSISARNAKQMELFRAGTLDRLDPFIEPREFRKLVRRQGGRWGLDQPALDAFPKYDGVRLAELSDPIHHPISLAAIALRRRDHTDDAARFHEQLLERAFQKTKDSGAIEEVLNAIRMTGDALHYDTLDHVRIELNGNRAMNRARERLLKMVAEAPASPDRTATLKSALLGISDQAGTQLRESVRDSIASARQIALRALSAMAMAGDPNAIAVIDQVASTDPAGQLRREAEGILAALRRGG